MPSMSNLNPRSTASIAGHPIQAMLAPIPATCFVGAFLADLAYWRTASVTWETFSIWLLTAGLIVGSFAMLAILIDFLGSRQIRGLRSAWLHAIGYAVALALSIVNAFVHSRDGYTAVVPEGIVLSGVVVMIFLVTGWMGENLVYRHRVGVAG